MFLKVSKIKSFKKMVIPILLLCVVPSIGYSATADDSELQVISTLEETTQQLRPSELMGMAQDYSIKNNAIGIFVNIAPNTTLTHQQIGGGLVSKFAEDGIQAAYIYSFAQEGDTSVSYYLKGKPYSNYGLDKAFEGYDKVLRHYNNFKNTDDIAASLLEE